MGNITNDELVHHVGISEHKIISNNTTPVMDSQDALIISYGKRPYVINAGYGYPFANISRTDQNNILDGLCVMVNVDLLYCTDNQSVKQM